MIMPIALPSALLAAAATLSPVSAPAQDVDALGRKLGDCMVLRSTGADRVVVARWLVGVLTSAPQAADMVTQGAGKKAAADQAMAAVFTRLLAKDCAAESKAVFALPGNSQMGFQIAGEALGRVAMTELMGDRTTATAMTAYSKYLKPGDFAGVVPK